MIVLIVVAYLVLYAFAFAHPRQPVDYHGRSFQLTLGHESDQTDKSLEEWISRESETAINHMLANIAPGGRNVEDAVSGTVVASPSREHPNYYFQWIRDAAITISSLVRVYSNSTSTTQDRLLPIIQAYASLQPSLQRTSNPSGAFHPSLHSLGEPKFHTTGRPFLAPWGRPQRDGPALRALTLSSFLRAFNASHSSLWSPPATRSRIYSPLYAPRMPPDSAIKADLEYVAHYWRVPGFDAWEEVRGLHFFTAMAQRRALREGAALARAFDDPGAADWYDVQARRMERELLPRFWEEGRRGAIPHVLATLGGDVGRSGLDCSVLLGALHGRPTARSSPTSSSTEDEEDEDSPSLYPPHSPPILATLRALAADMAARHPINRHPPYPSQPRTRGRKLRGIALGRYPSDSYDGYTNPSPAGGNPWFLCTAAGAQVLYAATGELLVRRKLRVGGGLEGVAFWRDVAGEAGRWLRAGETYTAGTRVFEAAVQGAVEAGDEFLRVVRAHAGRDGEMSEQIDGRTGFARGARDLTWSYGAFLEAAWERERAVALMREGGFGT